MAHDQNNVQTLRLTECQGKFEMLEFSAHFDGKNICPDEPLSLPANVPLRVTVNEVSGTRFEANGPINLFDRLEAEVGLVDGPSDWATQHDHFLYGAPNKSNHHAIAEATE